LRDGEAIVTDDKGLAVFELIRGHDTRRGAELCAFDLIELDGKDVRYTPIEERKRHLAKLLGRYQLGIVVNGFLPPMIATIKRDRVRLDWALQLVRPLTDFRGLKEPSPGRKIFLPLPQLRTKSPSRSWVPARAKVAGKSKEGASPGFRSLFL
jgi:hypothetical protein